jgi:drug/metabolite transporter (DMT)-like permease
MAGTVDTQLLSPFVMFWITWNLASSIGENYFVDIMTINGLKAAATYNFIADALSKVLAGALQPTPGHKWRDQHFTMAIVPSLIDATGQAFLMGGTAMAGAQTKAVLNSSTTVWAAVFSYFSLGRVLTPLQWAGIAAITLGVLIKKDYSQVFAGGQDGIKVLGMMMILFGLMLHALSGVVLEYFTRKCSVSAAKLGCFMGIFNMILCLSALAMGFIIPEKISDEVWIYRREDLEWIRFDDGSGFFRWQRMGSAVAWLALLALSTVHYSAYFNLIGSVGVVTVVTQKSLVTAGYVALSTIAFCDEKERALKDYCLTSEWLSRPPFLQGTVSSAAVCLAGVILYSYATHLKDARNDSAVRKSLSACDGKIDASFEKGASMDCESQAGPKGYGSVTN